MWGATAMVVAMTLAACSADRGTSPQEARELAGSAKAAAARRGAEAQLRSAVREYVDRTSLDLGLVVLRDTCFGGEGDQWLEPGDPYKIKCRMEITAYFGADPKRVASVLDEVLGAGERPGSQIPYTRAGDGAIRDYYRHAGVPDGRMEPGRMDLGSYSLSWDTLYREPPMPVEEPEACVVDDPPVRRCVREPAAVSVADIRKRHGMVFQLSLDAPQYFQLPKD
ncbi:hypothetical protein ACIPWL_00390 [Streptomyces sp. NPDC090023]|uniref:hypothetical protein n=1 Tax=unclassified Streptomyces TaxID=2593676 RepID=UPI00381471C4